MPLKGRMVGMAELGYTIDAEILPGHPHVKGALAAARQGDEVNPEKKSSGEQFYIVQGKTYTDQQLDLLEQRRLLRARNKLGGELYQAVQQEHQTYLRRGQVQQADSIVKVINAKIEERFSGENPFRFSPEIRELYKSVGGTPFWMAIIRFLVKWLKGWMCWTVLLLFRQMSMTDPFRM